MILHSLTKVELNESEYRRVADMICDAEGNFVDGIKSVTKSAPTPMLDDTLVVYSVVGLPSKVEEIFDHSLSSSLNRFMTRHEALVVA